MNILYIADSKSIHDLKWMRFFTEKHRCFLLLRTCHAEHLGEDYFREFEAENHIKIIGTIEDFSIRRFLQTYRQKQQLKKWIAAYKIDLLHLMYADPNALWAYFRKSLNLPIVLTTRGTDVLKGIPHFFEKKTLLNRLVAHCYKKALHNINAIACTSYLQKTSIEKLLPSSAQKISVIRTGVDVAVITADTKAYSLSELQDKPFVLFPRAMRPLYQQELAVAAIGALPEQLRKKYRFVFVDKNSPDKVYTEKIAAAMQMLDADILWLGSLDQLTLFQAYKQAALVVMTPMSDGTPVSAVEAMLCHAPLLLPPLPYDADLFSEGVAYFEDWQPSTLAARIADILQGQLPDTQKAFENALRLADRKKEMSRLGEIYDALKPA